MQRISFTYEGQQYIRVNKAAAWTAYKAGKNLIYAPCKCYPVKILFYVGEKACTSPTYWNTSRVRADPFVLDDTGLRNYFENEIAMVTRDYCYGRKGKYLAFYAPM